MLEPVAILLILIIILAAWYVYYRRERLVIVTMRDAGREWNVLSSYKNAHEAADSLVNVNRKMISFMSYLRKKYHIDETDDKILSEGASHLKIVNSPGDTYNIVRNLLDNYNPDAFYENDPRTSNETSYTNEKGSSMFLCLRHKKNPDKLVDPDTLLFVVLHEASHIANYKGWGHGPDFWRVFKFILYEANLAGVYTPIDYSKTPKMYCGLDITYNPLFDGSIKNIWI